MPLEALILCSGPGGEYLENDFHSATNHDDLLEIVLLDLALEGARALGGALSLVLRHSLCRVGLNTIVHLLLEAIDPTQEVIVEVASAALRGVRRLLLAVAV